MNKEYTFSERLKELLRVFNIKQTDLSNKTGISRSSISHYLKGDWEGKQDTVYKIASAFGINEAWLMGIDVPMYKYEQITADNIIPLRHAKFSPLVGTIACGDPILAEQNIEAYIPVPDEIRCDFCLRCKGDSMVDAGIHDGDLVYIRRQDDVDDGTIAAVMICGVDAEATLKRVYHNDNQITLMPANPAYSPILVTGETLSNFRILGVAVAVTSKL